MLPSRDSPNPVGSPVLMKKFIISPLVTWRSGEQPNSNKH